MDLPLELRCIVYESLIDDRTEKALKHIQFDISYTQPTAAGVSPRVRIPPNPAGWSREDMENGKMQATLGRSFAD